jgi:hypothetical protein
MKGNGLKLQRSVWTSGDDLGSGGSIALVSMAEAPGSMLRFVDG